jgi:U4/U6.U5 tri-snRNP-associated protein 1
MDIPRAQTQERDGEISCSIEETNRIRLALGLKPLDVSSSSSSGAKPIVDARVDPAKVREQEEARARIERSRRERELEAAQSAKGLGDILLGSSGGPVSAADWVRQSRADLDLPDDGRCYQSGIPQSYDPLQQGFPVKNPTPWPRT